ncbi:MAG: hypothetical protein JSS49_25425 [Planctomycetes bacterium]|nr:hypothetical protein [Planctomycetota bacterium]
MMRPRVLVIRIGAFGDICMLVPLVLELQRHFEVDWLIRDCYQPVAQQFPQLGCRTIGVQLAPDGQITAGDPLIDFLRSRHYDICIDFSHWPVVSRLVTHLQDIPVRAITRDPVQDMLLEVNPQQIPLEQAFNCVVDIDPRHHQVDKWRTLIQNACGQGLRLQWPLPPLRPPGEPLRVFVHPHAGKPNKLWPAARFAAILSSLARRRPIHVAIHRARGRLARSIQWRLLLSRCSYEVVPVEPTFRPLREQLQLADLAIGCDSGPMHFGSLLGSRTLVIYGPYSPREFGPLWRSTSVVPALDQQPASSVTTMQVETQLDAVLAQVDARAEHDPGEVS